MINGPGGGGHIEIREGGSLFMPQGTMLSKHHRINAEETKINFFVPNDQEEEEQTQGEQVDH